MTELLNLLHTYADLIDAGEFEQVGQLFQHAVLTAPGMAPISGSAAITALFETTTRRYADGTPRTAHVITNPVVDVDESSGRASVKSRFVVFQETAGLTLQPIISGRYHDDFERHDGRWRFSARHMDPSLLGDLHAHLLFDATALGSGPSAAPR